ncbi:hypothetical protein ACJRO7_013593 [Eucalyptus globulus]|uniref:EDS1 EP domain-containing protein n=1 Tax=Eucalyptus globulus TaxID=34317 RepID=A0ABD3L3D2_EUCGL
MDRDIDSLLSDGLYLANLAVSSNLLQDSSTAISNLNGDNPVIINEFHCMNYNIIAFVTSPVTTGSLEEERDLVPSLNIPNFQFLCSKTNPTFHMNKAAISLFNSLRNELSRLKEKVAILYILSTVSQYLTWNSCFLRVAHTDDCFPRPFLHSSTTNSSQYKPFGSFLLCSESGGTCFEARSRSVDYKTVIGWLEQRLIHNDCSWLNGQEADSSKAGVTTQVIVVGLKPIQWYMKVCKAKGRGPGFCDSFNNARERHDNGVDKYKTILSDYWEGVVKEAEKKPQIWGTPLRYRWLFEGTNYCRIVEPLDIAEYCRRGQKDYINRGKSKHYRLEKAGLSNLKLNNVESRVTEDLCFWAHVEEAIRSCRLLESGGSSNGSKIVKLVGFEKYVVGLIEKYKVSPDIFLEKSSYVQWWREYVEILERQMMGNSHNSQLVAFMRKERYKNYAEGSPRMFQEGHSNVNPPDSSNAGLRSTEGPKISPSPSSLQSCPRCLTLSLLLFLSLCLCLCLFHFLWVTSQKDICTDVLDKAPRLRSQH